MSEKSSAFRPLAEPAGTLSAENLKTLGHLRRAIGLADGFALFFARCNLPSQRDGLLARLAVLLERQSISSRRLNVAPPGDGLLRNLQATCDTAPGRNCAHVCGLERSMPYGDPHPPVLQQLNLARDRFRDLPCPVVFWLRDEAITRLAQAAPDLWAWRSGVFEFQPEPELARAAYRQARDDTSKWRNLPAEQKEERITALENLLEDYKALGDGAIERRARAELLLDLAELYQSVYRWPAAILSLEQALPLTRDLGDKTLKARAHQGQGRVAYFYQNEYTAALESYTQALALFRAVGARLGEANTRKAIGDVQQFRKEIDAALDSYTQALALFRAVGDRLGEANTLLSMARMESEPEAGRDRFEQALALYRAIGDAYSVARGLYYYALYLLEQGQKAEAIPLLEQSARLFEERGLSQAAATVRAALPETP